MRASLRYVTAKDTKGMVSSLKRIYQSASATEAEQELDALGAEWGHKYKAVVRLWRGNWANIIPFFQFQPEIRKVIYTTNAIESLNMSLRKLTRNRRIFPNDNAAFKSLYLAIQDSVAKLVAHSSLETSITNLSAVIRRRARTAFRTITTEVTQFV